MNLAQLLFDKMEVVQKPLSRRRDYLARLQGLRACAVGAQQDVGVFLDSARKRLNVKRLAGEDRLRRRKAPGVMLEPFGPKEIGPDR